MTDLPTRLRLAADRLYGSLHTVAREVMYEAAEVLEKRPKKRAPKPAKATYRRREKK